jgi:hypothetical protein
MEIMSENIFSKSSTARAKDQEKKMAANDLIDKSAQKTQKCASKPKFLYCFLANMPKKSLLCTQKKRKTKRVH